MDNQKVDISVELSGSVEDVIYKNADNGYTVINLGCDEGLIAVVGNLGDVNEGERLSLRGGWITSPKYGRQFKAAMCERSMPETESEISAYLGSGVINGLGPAIAKKWSARKTARSPYFCLKIPILSITSAREISRRYSAEK